MRSSLLLGSFTVGLRPVLAGLSALALAGCGSTIGDLAAFNAPGAKPAYFVDEQQIIPDEDSRLATLNGEMLQHFNVVLIVNKAASGEHAQTMMVMRPTSPGCGGCAWEASDIWDVSTGRWVQMKYVSVGERVHPDEGSYADTPSSSGALSTLEQWNVLLSSWT